MRAKITLTGDLTINFNEKGTITNLLKNPFLTFKLNMDVEFDTKISQ